MIDGVDYQSSLDLLNVKKAPENEPFYKALKEVHNFTKSQGTDPNVQKLILLNAIAD